MLTAPATTGPGDPIATLAGRPLISNRGIPLNLDWVQQVRVNTSAVERRAQSHVARRTVKKEWQAAWLLRAVSCMDLTTLSGDDTEERVRRLCAKARHPIQDDLVKRLGIEELDIKVAAVCVYHTFVETAVRALEGSGVRVAAVSTGFPAGLSPLTDASRKFAALWKPGPMILTWSSLALTCLEANGKPFTMRLPLSGKPPVQPI